MDRGFFVLGRMRTGEVSLSCLPSENGKTDQDIISGCTCVWAQRVTAQKRNRVKKDELVVVFNKKKSDDSYAFFSIL